MKEFFEKKSVVISVRIWGWLSLLTLVILFIWYRDIIEKNKVLSFTLMAFSILHDYKRDYKNISIIKRFFIICIWIITFIVCGYIGFFVDQYHF